MIQMLGWSNFLKNVTSLSFKLFSIAFIKSLFNSILHKKKKNLHDYKYMYKVKKNLHFNLKKKERDLPLYSVKIFISSLLWVIMNVFVRIQCLYYIV